MSCRYQTMEKVVSPIHHKVWGSDCPPKAPIPKDACKDPNLRDRSARFEKHPGCNYFGAGRKITLLTHTNSILTMFDEPKMPIHS